MKNIGVLIITFNEEAMIENCLKSVSWADEIIVIDAESSDTTAAIAKKYATVFQKPWQGFSQQKNIGIGKTTAEWILLLDADERVSKKLAQEITQTIQSNPKENAFRIRFKNIFLGKYMKHGGWNPEQHVRLFRRSEGLFNEKTTLHEEVVVSGSISNLTNPIYHLSHRTIADNLLKTREYALVNSERLVQQKAPKITRSSLFFGIVRHFFERYIRSGGYKDGMEGFIEATYQAFSQIFIIQSMVWERQRGDIKKIYQDIDQKILDGTYETP